MNVTNTHIDVVQWRMSEITKIFKLRFFKSMMNTVNHYIIKYSRNFQHLQCKQSENITMNENDNKHNNVRKHEDNMSAYTQYITCRIQFHSEYT